MAQEICCSKSEGYELIKQLGLPESTSGYPKGIEHFFADVLKPETVPAGGLTFTVALATSKNWKSALWLGLGVGTFSITSR